MNNNIKISPSIAAADQSDLRWALKSAEDGGADLIHLDIEDGIFIPNLTFGPKTVTDLRPLTQLPFDVHLQVMNPEAYADQIVQAGADQVSFQVEATEAPYELLAYLKGHNIQVGLAFLVKTPLDLLEPLIDRVDFVHLMTNDPNTGSDEFIPKIMDKITEAREMIRDHTVKIEVDGGINSGNVMAVVQAGANVLVAGRAIWNSTDPAKAVANLRSAVAGNVC